MRHSDSSFTQILLHYAIIYKIMAIIPHALQCDLLFCEIAVLFEVQLLKWETHTCAVILRKKEQIFHNILS